MQQDAKECCQKQSQDNGKFPAQWINDKAQDQIANGVGQTEGSGIHVTLTGYRVIAQLKIQTEFPLIHFESDYF